MSQSSSGHYQLHPALIVVVAECVKFVVSVLLFRFRRRPRLAPAPLRYAHPQDGAAQRQSRDYAAHLQVEGLPHDRARPLVRAVQQLDLQQSQGVRRKRISGSCLVASAKISLFLPVPPLLHAHISCAPRPPAADERANRHHRRLVLHHPLPPPQRAPVSRPCVPPRGMQVSHPPPTSPPHTPLTLGLLAPPSPAVWRLPKAPSLCRRLPWWPWCACRPRCRRYPPSTSRSSSKWRSAAPPPAPRKSPPHCDSGHRRIGLPQLPECSSVTTPPPPLPIHPSIH